MSVPVAKNLMCSKSATTLVNKADLAKLFQKPENDPISPIADEWWRRCARIFKNSEVFVDGVDPENEVQSVGVS